MSRQYPWRDENLLYELYIEKEMTTTQIAVRFDCNVSTVSRWLNKYDIDRDRPWRDEEILRKLYVDKGMTSEQIADKFGVGSTTVQRNLKKNGIETRKSWDYAHEGAKLRLEVNGNGYEFIHHFDDDAEEYVYIHRLTAIAEYGFDEVVGKDVHHVSEVPWDNRPSNLKPLTRAKHSSTHGEVGE